MSLVDDVVAAHGGHQRWRAARAVRVELSSGGLAFAVKGQPRALEHVTATVATAGQRVEITTTAGTFDFRDAIPPTRRGRWGNSDVAAFAASAIWTYVSIPFLLPCLDVTESGNRLIVHFPPNVRTHCPQQVLHVGDDGLITRHDYTALAFGRLARASQTLQNYTFFHGIAIATHRRVYPRTWPHRPLLVWIDIQRLTAANTPTGRSADSPTHPGDIPAATCDPPAPFAPPPIPNPLGRPMARRKILDE